MKIANEPFSLSLLHEIRPLAQACWEENTEIKGQDCAFYGEREYRVEPQAEYYQILDAEGRLAILTMRDGERLVGYVGGFTYISPHHRNVLCGNGDSIYIEPRFRSYAPVLVEKFLLELQTMGARIVGWPVPQRGPMYELLKSLGFVGDDIIMEKRLCVS